MAREFPIWVMVILPWLGALGCVLAARPGVRLLGGRRASMLGYYLGLGASALALLFTIQAIDHLLAPDDPRALGHTPLRELLGPVVIGDLRVEPTLIADRLSACAALLIFSLVVLARMFESGPSGRRDAHGEAGHELADARRIQALHRLALFGLLEGAAALVVLAGDLGLAALGWVLLGIGAALIVAREPGDERRASAATRVLALGIAGDLALGAAIIAFVVGRIGLAHNNMWAPLTGERLYTIVAWGISIGDLLATALLGATLLRLLSLAWAGNSLGEALLDAVLVAIPAVYLILRFLRVFSYAPTVLALASIIGLILALLGAAIGLLQPWSQARLGARPGRDLGLAGTGLAWLGMVALALGVAAWRTVLVLLIAHALGRLGLRLALLVADREQLPPWSARVGRLLCWGVAGIAPGLGFVAFAQTLVDVLTRNSLLAPWFSWLAAAAVLLVAFVHAAAIARLWYEDLGRKPGHSPASSPSHAADEEDGLDFGPLVLILVALLGLGLVGVGSWFGLTRSPLDWLDLTLPLAGGHEAAPTGLQERFRVGGTIGRSWLAGSAALVALVTGFAWTWTRERFRRAHGGELSSLTDALERGLEPILRGLQLVLVVLSGLTELAARGVGRGLFEDGPQILRSLARDQWAALAPRLRGLSQGGARLAMLGIVAGFGLVLGWLYAKPEAASALPSDGYGFGGLRPKLIKAGGDKREREDQDPPALTPSEASPASPIQAPLAPRDDGAEPGPAALPPELSSPRSRGGASRAKPSPEVPQ